jgi:3-hydroxyisobutyrate dehydrogenase-like beta-hydroxyacid dehydrogenase
MSETLIGLLHPGEMGAAVAGLTAAAGLDAAGQAADLARRAGIILSICPPHAALPVARAVAAAAFTGIYVDANAVSPGTAREVAAAIESAGARYVDGGIIGSPPGPAGSTRLYLSGPPAGPVAALFAGTALEPRVVGERGLTAASAVKMAYAGWTKGTAALILAVRALARAEGVEDTLLAEWALSQPGLAERSVSAARSAAGKGWRWTGEMAEISASMEADGLPGGFHQAAADVFRDPDRFLA